MERIEGKKNKSIKNSFFVAFASPRKNQQKQKKTKEKREQFQTECASGR